MSQRDFAFVGTEDIVQAVLDSEADDRYLVMDETDDQESIRVGRVTWVVSSSYSVLVPANNILFMEGNTWNIPHARAVLDAIHAGSAIEMPAARVYRVDATRVRSSAKFAKLGQLEEQLGMVRPWSRSDQGAYFAQLVDGNHRAAAALAAGASEIPVIVGENYRENVRRKDWI